MARRPAAGRGGAASVRSYRSCPSWGSKARAHLSFPTVEIDASPALGPAHGDGDPGLHDLWLLGPRAITATEASLFTLRSPAVQRDNSCTPSTFKP